MCRKAVRAEDKLEGTQLIRIENVFIKKCMCTIKTEVFGIEKV